MEVKLNGSHLFWRCIVPLAAVTGNAISVSCNNSQPVYPTAHVLSGFSVYLSSSSRIMLFTSLLEKSSFPSGVQYYAFCLE